MLRLDKKEIIMSQWQLKLEIKDIMEKLRSEEFTLQDGAKEIIKRLETFRPVIEKKFADYLYEYEEVIENFEIFSEDSEMNEEVEEFDYRLKRLYDWGDMKLNNDIIGGKAMCWINNL
jgi:hypothetical protein